MAKTTETVKAILELKQVSKIYTLGQQLIPALNKLSLKVCEGDFVVIMGASGSGKSTLLQVASMLSQATEGEIYLKGKNVTEYDEVERARLRNKEIGFIFQQFNLLAKTSAVEQVELPLIYAKVAEEERRERAIEMLKKLGLGDRLANKPGELSGGQQQRVAIARALVNNPSIIFADEPTGNLDSKSGAEIKKILIKLNKEGKTIILVTHDPNVAKIAKRQILIKDGQIIKDVRTDGKKCH
ncbi:ABC transporter ATP-binding protein [Candidatus Woesebacteria bacterium]|jgi:putative ABC transport system ATP-binding protein|nr:ABC transporter ATP-binding protein [Candidatus Woesebacteria bacterium]HNV44857.1 ABC transporter ATP-binding protein [Candidatus Woesebacteria bacterium]HOA12045.1 ABC transporter ATP-binding protein [Candidatus Woesebacteria bacterium]HOC07873.1 ABC transporter ATP-binding protein [Candidatus Woesebacteria bacterium]HOI05338.1 ABC transporter ATP-binding protein [Candidatus Woesebacteria bacterium]